MDKDTEILKRIATTVRTLAMDGVQKANSGHPGMPMGCAEIAAVLWGHILSHYPGDPSWPNRDRFVLSAGHGSMLLYTMLHLSGYDVSLDDLRAFRQWGSITPGHPEFGHTPGVETTTGPLGQGVANAVGMAYARRLLAAELKDGEDLFNHYTYVLAGDGDLMEGVSYEAASLAGHWKLGRLIVIYDSNAITIEGSTDRSFSENISLRFEAMGWQVMGIDGHDFEAINNALESAKKEVGRPTLIIARTRIAKGSPGKEGSEESHGAPLGEDEVKKTKAALGCDENGSFCVPRDIYDFFAERKKQLEAKYRQWNETFKAAGGGETEKQWRRFYARPDIETLRARLPVFDRAKKVATRAASGKVLESLFPLMPGLIGGSADLAPSNKSFVKGHGESGRGAVGRNIHFGIREHAMGAIQNGIAYYGGFIPYSATFFTFMDYMRPAVRIAALAKLPCIYVYTHDSIFVGEDGPTHQPVEHLAAARAIPGLTVIRPADAGETREAWLAALLNTGGPTALVLSRQDLPVLDGESGLSRELHRGAYVAKDAPKPAALIMAGGSELSLALEAAAELEKMSILCRVVSFPSWELFEKQDENYKKAVLPDTMAKRVVIEAGSAMGWERYAGKDALFITIDGFGASAPAGELARRYGFTVESVVGRVKDYLKR
ncbi:MAG TPA: transketolase [Spirochaetes bacterium]|nr:transketolase [Spirochaetota bacterium]